MASPLQWEQQDDEPDMWFDRFEIFRLLGPIRSVAKAYELAKETEPGVLNGKHPNPQWHEISKKWDWPARARAWDLSLREKLREQSNDLAIDRQLSRLQMIGELQKKAYAALVSANIEAMTQSEARSHLPQIRMLMIALLGSERAEFGGAANEDGEQPSDLPDEIMRNLKAVYGKEVAVSDGAGVK